MLLLGIDASSQAAGAAVVQDGTIICEYTLNRKKTHSAHLLPMTERMLADAELTLEEMDGFACGIGPGSFTGVRIGTATVKGFAQALGKPVVTVNSLETLAFGCGQFDGLIIPVIFARVDEVFCAAYRVQENRLAAVLPPTVLKITELLEKVRVQHCLFVGDGALRHQALIAESLGEKAGFAAPRQHLISAANLTLLAERKREESGWERYDSIAPLYLRVSQAEREYQEKHGGNER